MTTALAHFSLAALVALLLGACGGGGGGSSPAPPPSGANNPPVFTSTASDSVPENSAGAVYTATATDTDGDTITYSISGGEDSALLAINASSGAVIFRTAPNFEAPRDANGDNVFRIVVAAWDGQATATQNVDITVTNVAGRVGIRRISTGFAQPLFLAGRGEGRGRVLIVQKGGLVREFDTFTGEVSSTPLIQLAASEISTDGERGVLGLAMPPDFATSGLIYVFATNPSGAIEIQRYGRSPGTTSGKDVIMTIPHPRNNHLGGWIGFDANGLLYIAIGDGGGAGDPDGNGQNTNSLLGKVLRIDPRTDAYPADASRDYAIPAGNPFASGGGAPEIWLYGLRNPFRNSFDRASGNLIIADVGQDVFEEINLARASDGGANFGWNILEGTQPYAGGSTAGLTPPVLQYPHGAGAGQGGSVTGGYVYRGPVTQLRGTYVFGDFVAGRIFSVAASDLTPGVTRTVFQDRTSEWAPEGGFTINNISSFGEDDAGNLYVLDYDGEIFMIDEIE